MDREDKATITAFTSGVGSTVASMALPQAYPDAPLWLWQLLFWVGVTLMALSGLYGAYDHLIRPHLASRRAFTSGRPTVSAGTTVAPQRQPLDPHALSLDPAYTRLKLMLGPKSLSSPEVRLTTALQEFNKLADAGESGDQKSAQLATLIAEWLDDAAKSYYASSSKYFEIYNAMQGRLARLDGRHGA